MDSRQRDVVTGAFSFTGKYIAQRLVADGRAVTTLTNHPERSTTVAEDVRVEPYRFEDPDALADSLAGADTLYNTFWIRNTGEGPPPGNAIRYSRRLITAAEHAGVRRIVHFSVSNAPNSEIPYYRAKATVEQAVRESSLSHAILRPTLIFGLDDLLLNNLAWLLRRFPVFPVFGDGDYRIQPVFVGDVADAAVDAGTGTEELTLPLAGPETFTFEGLLQVLADALSTRCRVLHTPPRLAHLGVRVLEALLRDRILTWDEARGLMDELLATDTDPVGETQISDWLAANATRLGTDYTSYRERYAVSME